MWCVARGAAPVVGPAVRSVRLVRYRSRAAAAVEKRKYIRQPRDGAQDSGMTLLPANWPFAGAIYPTISASVQFPGLFGVSRFRSIPMGVPGERPREDTVPRAERPLWQSVNRPSRENGCECPTSIRELIGLPKIVAVGDPLMHPACRRLRHRCGPPRSGHRGAQAPAERRGIK